MSMPHHRAAAISPAFRNPPPMEKIPRIPIQRAPACQPDTSDDEIRLPLAAVLRLRLVIDAREGED